MTESSKKRSYSRESIIGLGEDSFRKNYYPELQSKINDLNRTLARNRAIIHTIPDLLLVRGVDGEITPFDADDHSAMTQAILNDPILVTKLHSNIDLVENEQLMRTIHFTLMMDMDKRFLEARINISDKDEVLIIIRDITDQRTLEMRLREMADKDSLTGMYNRRVFEEKMAAFNNRRDVTVALIIVDIDGLKMLNDTLGHKSGDFAITSVANMVDDVFGGPGLVSRLSGDEFGILLISADEVRVEEMLRLLDARVANANRINDTVQISISHGYAVHDNGAFNYRMLFEEADNNMYKNKMFKSASVRSSLVKTLMKALEARDYITEGHADRLEHLALRMGKQLGMSQKRLDQLQLLTKFHDIGKVGIPDYILKKPGKLSEGEFKIMRTHTQIGKRIADESVDLRDISNLILYHHERWDGQGYPLGIAGEEIPLECRILSIVDAFDAMTNDRPYRKALPYDKALEEVRRNAGGQFDPHLSDLFLAMWMAEEQLADEVNNL